MPRKPTLLPTFLMLAALCCATAAATARAQEEVEVKPRPAADALKAASLCEQARTHAAAGSEGIGDARTAFAQGVKLYLRIYQKERAARLAVHRARIQLQHLLTEAAGSRAKAKGAPRDAVQTGGHATV